MLTWISKHGLKLSIVNPVLSKLIANIYRFEQRGKEKVAIIAEDHPFLWLEMDSYS